jgi:hypothetical protein
MKEKSQTEYPDIEIYISRASIPEICSWLQNVFSSLEVVNSRQKERIQHYSARTTGEDSAPAISILMVENAKDNFTAVTFQSPDSPWVTDLECARYAAGYFNHEIRCSTGSWEQDQATDEWFSLRGKSETTISWE